MVNPPQAILMCAWLDPFSVHTVLDWHVPDSPRCTCYGTNYTSEVKTDNSFCFNVPLWSSKEVMLLSQSNCDRRAPSMFILVPYTPHHDISQENEGLIYKAWAFSPDVSFNITPPAVVTCLCEIQYQILTISINLFGEHASFFSYISIVMLIISSRSQALRKTDGNPVKGARHTATSENTTRKRHKQY